MATINDQLDEFVKEALANSTIAKSNKGDKFQKKAEFAAKLRNLGHKMDPGDIDRRINKLENRAKAALKDTNKNSHAATALARPHDLAEGDLNQVEVVSSILEPDKSNEISRPKLSNFLSISISNAFNMQ